MAEMTAEQFAQRAYDLDLLDARQLETIWSELGSRYVPVSDLTSLMLRKELLTNFQIERLLGGKRAGYFYGSYKTLYLVGSGTFARVYRAVHTDTGQVVAVKVLRHRYLADPTTTERFLREARMVMPLRHPNIVPVYEVRAEGGSYFMVMDFVEGRNLRDFLKVRKKLGLEESLRLIGDCAAGLDYAFQRGMTHRDMKLSNILISSHGRARLVDFGLAAFEGKVTDANLEGISNPRSIDYAGLERATGVRRDDRRSDIYFAGCVLYHMLAGRPPLIETKDRIQRLSISRFHDVRSITDFEPNLPHRVVAIINKAMDLNPDRRYSTPGELLEDIKVAADQVDAGFSPLMEEESPSDAQPQRTAAPARKSLEGDSRTVMLVESAIPIQNALRSRLKDLGYRVLVISDPDRALQRFERGEQAADCVVFGTGDLGQTAIDAFNSFADDELTCDFPAILLVDDKNLDAAQSAKLAPHRVTLPLPLKFRELRSALLKLCAATKASS